MNKTWMILFTGSAKIGTGLGVTESMDLILRFMKVFNNVDRDGDKVAFQEILEDLDLGYSRLLSAARGYHQPASTRNITPMD